MHNRPILNLYYYNVQQAWIKSIIFSSSRDDAIGHAQRQAIEEYFSIKAI